MEAERQRTTWISMPRQAMRRGLLRGESLIASVGIGGSLILLAVMAAAAWWAVRSQQDALLASQREELSTLAQVLGPNVSSMLAADDLPAVRRTIVDVRRSYSLVQCRIRLPNGQILADGVPSKITAREMPKPWPTGPLDAAADANEANAAAAQDRVAMTIPLRIAGKGPAMLEMAAEQKLRTPLAGLGWEAVGGVGIIAACGLAGLLAMYRRVRARLQTMGLIREALLAMRCGETVKDALSIGGERVADQAEATAWNELVTEILDLRHRSRSQRAGTAAADSQPRREGRGELRQACDALPHGMLTLDEQGRISYLNGAAAVFLRAADRDALLGTDASKVFDNADLQEAIRAALSGTGKQRRTIELERTDSGQVGGEGSGGGIFRITLRSLRREDGMGVMVSIEDITQQRVAAASRNAFVAQATHELRTPLTNIRLYLETALDEGENDAAMRSKCLNVIGQESRRLERMVGQMLSVAEIEAGSVKIRRDDVVVEKLFHDLEADYQAQAKEKNITLAFELPPKLPTFAADRDKLLIALHNLIANALKYTPDGGKVTVRAKAEGADLLVDVVDTGFGIDPKEQSLIFEKFYRSSDPRVGRITGTGLGLSLARELVRLHGGEIALESELNKGSTFTIRVPAVKEAA